MKIKSTTLLLLFIGSTLFAQKNWNILEQNNYAISYPKDWQSSDQKPDSSIQFFLLSDEKSQKEDEYRENINLKLENLSGQEMELEGQVSECLTWDADTVAAWVAEQGFPHYKVG